MKKFFEALLLLAVCVGLVVGTVHLNSQLDFLIEVARASSNLATIAKLIAGMLGLTIVGFGAIAAYFAAINKAFFGEELLRRREVLLRRRKVC